MKILLEESRPGEFDGNPELLKDKIRKAAEKALRAIVDGECQHENTDLVKAHQRGGEIRVVEELAEQMGDLYKKRIELLNKAVREAINAGL